jgi:predicted ATPase/DNA-binding XRE family transcriptional regulator
VLDQTTFGEWLRKRRRASDLTRQALADQAGCAEITLRRIENGTLKPSKELAQILLEKLGIPEFERSQWILFARGLSSFPIQPLDTFASPPLTNLPASLTTFIGREKEQTEIIKLIKKHRLVTLTGPGGVGKTRLSIKTGEQLLGDYANGVWLVELASLNDPALLPSTLITLFGMAAQTKVSPTDMLINFLRTKTILLIIDNCEHLLEACAQLTDTLLKNCANLKILVTSRESLNITGEAAYPVPSLGLPDLEQLLENFRKYESVRLFEERAQLAQMDFSLTLENASSVAQICHRLDGIPLAIELASAHVSMFSTEQIAAQLNESFKLLTGGSRTALPRQQTIRASIEWGWNLLTDSERILLQRLSVFAGGWILASAESACSDAGIEKNQIQDLLSQLVAKSLVVTNQESGRETRYHLLETIRQYANGKLEESEKEIGARDSHLNYFLDLAETAAPNLFKPEQLEWLARLDAEQGNLRAALNWSLSKENPEYALRLSAALGTFWNMRCHWIEGSKWLESALSKPSSIVGEAEKIARVRALYQDAELAEALDDIERIKTSANLSFTLAQAGIDKRDIAIARFYVGWAYYRQEDSENVRPLFEQCLTEFRELNDAYWEANTYRWLSHILVRKGEMSRNEKNKKDLELARKSGERLLLADILLNQATWAWNDRQFDKAEADLQESEILNMQIGYKGGMGAFHQAVLAHYKNDYQQAKIMYEKVREQYDLIGEKGIKSLAIVNLGMVAREEGDYPRAQSYIEEALKIAQEIGSSHIIGYRLALLGEIQFLQGDIEGTKQNFKKGLLIGRELVDERYTISGTLVIFSNSFMDVQPQNAVRVTGAAHAYLQKFDEPLESFFLRNSDRAVAQARQHLDEFAFNEAWSEGEKMTINEAYDLALKTVEEL